MQKLKKVVSAILAITILYANAATLVSYAAEEFLTQNEIESQRVATNNANVEFDVFYEDGTHTKTLEISETTAKLNMEVNVKNAGYLKDITVDFSDSNFEISDDGENADVLQELNSENKKVTLNQINSGNRVIKAINISAIKDNELDQDSLNRDNKIKLTAIYVNENGKEVQIEKIITIHTGWNTQNASALLGYEITKYIPYAINGENKLITQGKITSGIENSILPIKSTQIEIDTPKINNQYPESVTVIANNTSATNGDETGENFTKENWEYNNENGKIIINVTNSSKNGKISWLNNSLDEYLITYIYSENTYEEVKDKQVRITYNANSNITLYNDGTGVSTVTANVNGYKDQTGKIGEIIDLSVNSPENLNKGYLYNNKVATQENKKETIFTQTYKSEISVASLMDSIILTQKEDMFVRQDGTEISANSYNKKLTISKKEFDKIFGEEGIIQIFDNSNNLITTINKETPVENENIVIDLSDYKTNVISIKTSKHQTEGNITFNIEKAIKTDLNYTTNQIQEFKTLKTRIIEEAKNEDIKIADKEIISEIKLEEPTQKSSITINKNTLSTILKNEGIEIKVTLENDSIDDKMYTNPTVKINLPANIEQIDVNLVELYFDNELVVGIATIQDNDDGTKTITIELQGTQTKYNNIAAKGATITIFADITLNKLTPTTDTNITMSVQNGDVQKTTSDAQVGVQYIAPTGVVTTNSIANYNNSNETTMSISGKENKAVIPTLSEGKEAQFTMNVINNYETELNNIVILGRTPFAGNKDITTNQDLGSNVDMPLTSEITLSNVEISKATIYYSTNGEATRDLSSLSNDWTTNPSNIREVKSYMIVFTDYTMERGENFTFSYKANIPSNLEYNKSAFENYAVYYTNTRLARNAGDTTNAPTIGITTGSGPIINASLTSELQNGESTPSGSVLKYKLTVNNTGTEVAQGLKATLPIDDSVIYVVEDTTTNLGYKMGLGTTYIQKDDGTSQRVLQIDIDNIEKDSTITKDIWLLTTATGKEEKQIDAQVTVSNGTVEAITNKITNTLTRTYFRNQISSTKTTVDDGDTYRFSFNIKSSETFMEISVPEGMEQPVYDGYRENTVVKLTLPSELTIAKIEKEGEDITNSATINNNTILINIGRIDYQNTVLSITLNARMLDENVYEKELNILSSIYADGIAEENLSNFNVTISKPAVEIIQTSSIPSNTSIKPGEQYTYTFAIRNLSSTALNDINFIEYLPKELIYSGAKVSIDHNESSLNISINEEGNPVVLIARLEGKSTATIEITVTADALEQTATITNKASITQEKLGTIYANEITNNISKFEEQNPDEEDTPPIPVGRTRRITGAIWVDKNNDGIKNIEETKLSGVTVLLLNNSTSDIAITSNGEKAITTTDNEGTYVFSDIVEGSYTVIFLYDSGSYSPTTYQKEGVLDIENSDATDREIVYEGENRIAAVTEAINLTGDNQYNIDLGLVENPKFDLSLDQIVKTITVNNGKQTTTYEYNKDFAKVDINTKYETNTTLVVEYELQITNQGAVPGYAKRIANYLPEELKFSTELNPDWYIGTDGTLYNTALANTIINPGETKTVKLILTKSMTSESYGTITNEAELYETSNDYGLKDIDSTTGNKVKSEDDYSTSNVIISPQTGEIIIYTTLIITTIAIIGVGIYVIKKRVLI